MLKNMESAELVESTTKAGSTPTFGRHVGMEVLRPWPASLGALTAIQINIPKQN